MTAPQVNDDTIAKAVRRATIDPDWFCRRILQCPNDIWQSEMMDVIADLDRASLGLETKYNHELRNRITVRSFHGPGKTHWIAKLMHWHNFTRKGKIIVTAPKQEQVKTRVWPEFRKILGLAIPEYRTLIKPTATQVLWLNDPDWVALIESAASPENLAGHHNDRLLFLVDEASGVNEMMFPAIEGALTGHNSILALIGNPTRTQGEFHASHKKKGTKESYYRKAIKHHETSRITQKWVDEMIRKYGKDSPVVKVRVFGEFVDAEENQLIALEWVEDAIGKEFVPDGSIPRVRVSVDVADGGIDSSVVSVAVIYESFMYLKRQHVFNFAASISPIETAKAAARIFDEEMKEHPHCEGDLVIDSIGVGAGTAGWLIDANYPIIAYKGGAASDNPKLWANRRTQSYLSYRDALRDGEVVISEHYCDDEDLDDFLAQHTSIRKKEGDRIEELETKKDMKARGIKSPDMPDSIKMHFATIAPYIGTVQTSVIAIPSEANNGLD